MHNQPFNKSSKFTKLSSLQLEFSEQLFNGILNHLRIKTKQTNEKTLNTILTPKKLITVLLQSTCSPSVW